MNDLIVAYICNSAPPLKKQRQPIPTFSLALTEKTNSTKT